MMMQGRKVGVREEQETVDRRVFTDFDPYDPSIFDPSRDTCQSIYNRGVDWS